MEARRADLGYKLRLRLEILCAQQRYNCQAVEWSGGGSYADVAGLDGSS